MNDYAVIVAKKYAQAFLNIAGDSFGVDDFKKVCALATFLKQHRAHLFFLRSPAGEERTINAFLERLLAPFGPQTPITKLVMVLARHRRLFLLSLVVQRLCQLYAQQHHITHFYMESSHELSDKERAELAAFLVRSTHDMIVYDYARDPRLIAGIRLRSDILLWEYSVNAQLKQITKARIG